MFLQHTQMIDVPVTSFGINAKSSVKGLADIFAPAIPKIEFYDFDLGMLQDFLAFIALPDDSAYWLWGLHGTGKTSFIEQVCARLNMSCYSITGSKTLEIEDLLYQNILKPDGSTGVELDKLAQAFKYGGVFLFNEIDLVDPSKLTALNEVLSGSTLIIPGIDEVIHKHEAFRFVVTANTNGSFDDESGIGFDGTETMNISFMDRFIVNQAHYLPVDKEKNILEHFAKETYAMVKGFTGDNLNSHTKSIVPIISKMISVAGESRKSAMNTSSFDRPISIRGLKRWLQKTIQFSAMDNSIEHAFKQSILNAYPPSQRPALNEFYKDVI